MTDPALMTQPARELLTAADTPDGVPAPALTRRLAAAGLRVYCSRNQDRCTLDITGAATGGSSVIMDTSGRVRWYYEPADGTGTNPATLARVIAHLLHTPCTAATTAGYATLPLKGKVGRILQDHGLTVDLLVTRDYESFEATTDIGVSSPARPWLGTVTLSDDAAIEWTCNWWAAFHDNPATLIDIIIPVLTRKQPSFLSPIPSRTSSGKDKDRPVPANPENCCALSQAAASGDHSSAKVSIC